MNAVTLGLDADDGLMSHSASPDGELIRTCRAFAEAELAAWYRYVMAPVDEADDNDTPPDRDTLHWIQATPATTPEGWQAKALAYAAWDRDSYDAAPENQDGTTLLLSSLLRDMAAPGRNAIVARLAEAYGPLPKGYTAEGIWLGAVVAYGEDRPVAAPVPEPRDAKLVGLCRTFDDLERRYVLAIEAAETEAEYRAASEILTAGGPVVDSICQHPPTTCAGVLALAGTVIGENSELLDEPQPFRTDRLQHTLLRGLAMMARKGASA